MKFEQLLVSVLFVEIVNTQTEYEDLQRDIEKRAAAKDPYSDIYNYTPPFTPTQQIALLKIHNLFRSRTGASDMEMMFWNYTLEKVAQSIADKCRRKIASKMRNPIFTTVGVRQFPFVGGSLKVRLTLFVSFLHRASHFFNYSTNNCKNKDIMCYYYMQMAWHNSSYLGCGVRHCPYNPDNKNCTRYFNLVVCNYASAGKFENPNKLGKACTECPKGKERCHNDMCRPEKCVYTSCKNGGKFMSDICYCDCTDTGYVGDQCEVRSTKAKSEPAKSRSVSIHIKGNLLLLAACVLLIVF